MIDQEHCYKPPPCSVFVVRKQKSKLTKGKTFKRIDNHFIQKNGGLEPGNKHFNNSEMVSAEKQIKAAEWKQFLDTSNKCKFRPGEWIDRWLNSLEIVKEFGTDEKDSATNMFVHSDSGTDDSAAEVVWEGSWGGHCLPNQAQNSTSSALWKKRNCKTDASVVQRGRTFTKSSIEGVQDSAGMHDDTSGLGSSEPQQQDSASIESYFATDEHNYEFDVARIFSGSNEKLFVTLCCDNSADTEMRSKIEKRQVYVCQKKISIIE